VTAKTSETTVAEAVDKKAAATSDGQPRPNAPTTTAGVAGERLLSFITRIERLNEEKHAMLEDIREVFKEAKGIGYDVPTIRKLLKIRGMDVKDLEEQEALLETYAHAIGMKLPGE
jgi:uncharacterized protein (UPF0335 family)